MECVSSEGVNQGLRGQGEGPQEGRGRADFGPAVSDDELAGEAGTGQCEPLYTGQGASEQPGAGSPAVVVAASGWDVEGEPLALSGCWHGGWWEVVVGRSRAWHGRVSMSER